MSFEAVLQAQLTALAGAGQEPATLAAAADPLEPGRTAAEPAPQDGTVPPPDTAAVALFAPMPATLPLAQPPAEAAPEVAIPSPSLPDTGASRTPRRPGLQAGGAEEEGPAPQRPDAARIAGPTAGTLPQPGAVASEPARSAAAPLPAADPVPAAQAAPGEGRASENPAALVAIGAERAEHGRAAPPPPRLDVAASLGSREFGREVGERLVWMVTQNRQVAELRIDPPQLGPVEVHLSISNDQASLSLVSPHAAVRDALQANLPRLQEMLQGLGLALDQVSVGAEGAGRHAPGSHTGSSDPAYPRPGPAGLHGGVDPPASSAAIRMGRGVVDVYV